VFVPPFEVMRVVETNILEADAVRNYYSIMLRRP
jgi:hypothetical protein